MDTKDFILRAFSATILPLSIDMEGRNLIVSLMEDSDSIFQGPFFTVEYPDDWEVEIIEDIPAFYDPMGGGALQIIAIRKTDEPVVLTEDMEKYLMGMDLQYEEDKMRAYQHAAGPCLACEFIKEGRFWLINMIGENDRMLIVLYNSDDVPDQNTVLLLMDMIKSIRMTDDSN